MFAHFRASVDVACDLSSQGIETRVIVSLQSVVFFVTFPQNLPRFGLMNAVGEVLDIHSLGSALFFQPLNGSETMFKRRTQF